MLPGIGFSELLLLGLAALIIVGPKDLPMMMRRIGQFVGKGRAMAREFQAAFEDIARQSELVEGVSLGVILFGACDWWVVPSEERPPLNARAQPYLFMDARMSIRSQLLGSKERKVQCPDMRHVGNFWGM